MAGLFRVGEKKERPGIYRRYEKTEAGKAAAAMNGVFCIPIKASFGPVGTVRTIGNKAQLFREYLSGQTLDAAEKLFDMGANAVHVYRLGSGGKKASLEVNNTESSLVVTLSTANETELPFAVTIRQQLGNAEKKECCIYNGSTLLEKVEFLASDNEIDSFVEAMKDSQYLIAEKAEGASGTLEIVNQKALTGGTGVTVTNEDYSTAFSGFEPYRFNVLVLDTTAEEVKAVAKAFMARLYENGGFGICVLGEDSSLSLKTRMEHARSCNAPYLVCCGSGYRNENGEEVDGYLSAAVQAGIIGSQDTSKSIVHTQIPDARECLEKFTDDQSVEAIRNGLLLLSEGPDGQVWFDSGVNTYTNLAEQDDEGWKKIKRTAVRQEAFDRINRTLEPLIGKINCDSNGVDNVIKLAKDVLDNMVLEGKILDQYEFMEDPDQPHSADSAYFLIRMDDIDTLEKVYLTYQFRYAAE